MARFLSVHPGLFTDEAFVSLSPIARVLLIGIWTEADDMGAFEWKPIQLKMRVLPVDNIDVASLMDELAAANVVAQYEVDRRQFGAIRNFGKFQRPKKPKSVHPMPEEWRKYAASERPGSEQDEDDDGGSSESGSPKTESVSKKSELKAHKPSSVPPKAEIAAQMEDGGDKMEEEEKISLPSEARPSDELDLAVSAWNSMAAKVGLPAVQKLTDPRKRSLRLRVAECGGIEGWRAALSLVEASSFLRGDSGRWSADFDFLLQAKSFTKLMEGGYADRKPAEREGPLTRMARESRMRGFDDQLEIGGLPH